MMTLSEKSEKFAVVALYRFFNLADPDALACELCDLCRALEIRGTLLLAREGINGTVAGRLPALHELIDFLHHVSGFEGAEIKFSSAEERPFRRMKVHVKKEIVTMGIPDIHPGEEKGEYVSPADWNALILDPSTVVVDTRNHYEVSLGSFPNAVDPKTYSFSEFPAWVQKNYDTLTDRKVAMFCTGGIRCEKATAYLKSLGLKDVFHLKGGILKYLEEKDETESLWHGECFVFDGRVSVSHGLKEGEATLCYACRHPLTEEDRSSASYSAGISCPHCLNVRSEKDRMRYSERQKQIALARRRGDVHLC